MKARLLSRVAAAAALAAAALAPPAGAVAAPATAPIAADSAGLAAPDSSLDAYIRRMADSTDAYFGRTAAPTDTAGLDSALAYGLAHPGATPGPRLLRPSFGPWLRFNRADGGVMGAETTVGRRRTVGALTARLAYANGPNDWLGGGEYRKLWLRPGTGRSWALEVAGGRSTDAFDRDHFDPIWSTFRAFAFGDDRNDYLRRDGARVSLERETATWRAGVALRDELESPLPTTAAWSLGGHGLDLEPIDVAAFGRAREARFSGSLRLPRVPVTVEAAHWTSGRPLGSDFTYRRSRVAAGGDFAITRHLAVATQAEYGRLRGETIPQEAFFAGGGSSLRSLDRGALRGSGKALGRLDLILRDDVIRLLGFPGSPSFPIQLGAFAGSGAVWGREPLAGAFGRFDRVVPTSRDWPESNEWLSEAGVSLLYRPGLPEPDAFVRIDYVIPIGGDDRERRVFIGFQRPFNLIRPLR